MITIRAGYAYGIKDHDSDTTTFNLCREQDSTYGLLIRVRQNAILGLELSEILKVQVQKKRPEDAKRLESLLGTTNDKK